MQHWKTIFILLTAWASFLPFLYNWYKTDMFRKSIVSRFFDFNLPSLTLCEVIPGGETSGLQFTISHKLDVQVPPTGPDIRRTFLPTVATNDGRETKGPIAYLDVVKLTLPGGFDGVLLIEEQVNALSRSGWGRRRDWKQLKRGLESE